MTDEELIVWLKSLKGLGWSSEAADRIEALTKERNAARGALMNAGAALHVAKREAEAAEAENARLREALAVVTQFKASTSGAMNVHAIWKMTEIARAALKPAPTVTAGWPAEEGEGSIIVGETK